MRRVRGQRVNARLIYGRPSDRVEFSHPYVDPSIVSSNRPRLARGLSGAFNPYASTCTRQTPFCTRSFHVHSTSASIPRSETEYTYHRKSIITQVLGRAALLSRNLQRARGARSQNCRKFRRTDPVGTESWFLINEIIDDAINDNRNDAAQRRTLPTKDSRRGGVAFAAHDHDRNVSPTYIRTNLLIALLRETSPRYP